MANQHDILSVLQAVQSGALTPEEALLHLKLAPYEDLGYKEEREFIKKTKRKKKKGFLRETYPKDPRDQVRYFYRNYLRRLKKSDLEIEEGDSSLDIKNKDHLYPLETRSKIREIYIKTRYQEGDIDRSQVEEMSNLYKDI